ncbi:hypothetical protein B296_00015248 [Ensete ventricosum]|uniref:Uncharacterized protein n=1 Tax=Ensete ventricosum TaxID=4639 RepID=A0A427B6N5_ENSVE|nr:hypothetical protein B296_00015248 [Ensete ventricosum]
MEESPYNLALVTKAILPPEVVFPTLRIKHFEEKTTGLGLRVNLDLIEELRVEVHLRFLTYQKVIAQLYNRRVRPRRVGDGDLVLRKAKVNNPGHTRGKLASVLGHPHHLRLYLCYGYNGWLGATRTWHISNLKKFYA